MRPCRTKIIATLGPVSESLSILKEMIDHGLSLVRLNFSHGCIEQHRQRVALVRQAAAACGREIGILADLQGPKIRIARFQAGLVALQAGAAFCLQADLDENVGDETRVGIDYKALPRDVRAGDTLLLDDGRLVFTVARIEQQKIHCIVKVGGNLSNNKGINRLGGGLSAAALTDKDRADLKIAVGLKADYIAVSFPRSAADIREAQALIEAEQGVSKIIAKIERAEAVQNLDDIIHASDGVMVARGDLAVEIGDTEVPGVQKHIIQQARTLNKPVITATQMMESMISNPIPTRAEVSDVANAVLDGTDAVMLSAESAVGDFPVKVIEVMKEICLSAEKNPIAQVSKHRVEVRFERVDEAVAMASMYIANHLDIKAIICLTESGSTPLWMSRIRSGIPIYALSRHRSTCRRVTLYRGVYPVEFDVLKQPYHAFNASAISELTHQGILQIGDRVILTKGEQLGVDGGSNALKILTVT